MRKDHFKFGAVNSLQYGAVFTDVRTEKAPKRDIEKVSVPGRSGDLTIDRGRWHNVEVTYRVSILADFMENFDRMKAVLLSQEGYQKLEDSIRPNEYRLAIFHNSIEPENKRYNQVGTFDVVFDCKPQRFLKSGDDPIEFTADGTIVNPTTREAMPLITVTGTGAGEVSINGVTVQIKSIDGSMILDCENENAYSLSAGAPVNENANIYAPQFPVLVPGENSVSFTGGITSVQIVPRWWEL